METGIRVLPNGVAVPKGDQLHGVWCANEGLVHDTFMMGLLQKYINAGDTVVDIGAHIGSHAMQYSIWTGTTGKVYCFEAGRVNFECLRYNIGGVKNCSLHNVALGSKRSERQYNYDEKNAGASFMSEGSGTQVVTLDSFNLSEVSFIKIDVEGMEPDVLYGAEQTILKNKPTLFIEINQGALKRNNYTRDCVFDILHKFGYEFREITGTIALDRPQYDIICQPIAKNI